MTKQELAKLLYDIHSYCHFVSGGCEECAISPCKLYFEKDGYAVFPYEWDIERADWERDSDARE
jgi:hypothetical protein